MKPINRFSLLHDPIIHDRLNKMVEQLNSNFNEQESTQLGTSVAISAQATLIKALTDRIAALEQNTSVTTIVQEVVAATTAKAKAPVPAKKKKVA